MARTLEVLVWPRRRPKLRYWGFCALKSDDRWYLSFRRQETNGLLTWISASDVVGDGTALAEALRAAGLPSRVSFYSGECLVYPYGRNRSYGPDGRILKRVLETRYPTLNGLPVRWVRENRVHE